MELNVNNLHTTTAVGGSMPVDSNAPPDANRRAASSARTLTISHAVPSKDEISGAEVPETSLTRNDKLGDFIASVFNLPPPPMPNFAS